MKLLAATRSAGKQREMRRLLEPAGIEVVFPDEPACARLRPRTRWSWPTPSRATPAEGGVLRPADRAAHRGRRLRARGLRAGRRAGRPLPPLGRGDGDGGGGRRRQQRRAAPPAGRSARGAAAGAVSLRAGVSRACRSGTQEIFEGACAGSILEEPRGAGGFGYDPLFLSDELGKTFGEATAEEKDAVSHRGRAFRAFTGAVRAR